MGILEPERDRGYFHEHSLSTKKYNISSLVLEMTGIFKNRFNILTDLFEIYQKAMNLFHTQLQVDMQACQMCWNGYLQQSCVSRIVSINKSLI